MRMTFGKRKGMTIEELVLRDPNYIIWMLGLEDPQGEMPFVCEEVRKLIDIFDRKRFVNPCQGRDCPKPATRCTVSHHGLVPIVWCDTCVRQGIFQIDYEVTDYLNAATILNKLGGSPWDLPKLIQPIAQAKGLPANAAERDMHLFFHPNYRANVWQRY